MSARTKSLYAVEVPHATRVDTGDINSCAVLPVRDSESETGLLFQSFTVDYIRKRKDAKAFQVMNKTTWNIITDYFLEYVRYGLYM